MSSGIRLDEDHHVHSTFSDDAHSTLGQNVGSARARGLRVVCLAEHVRRSTTWVPDFLAAASAVQGVPGLTVLTGLESKILDRSGQLDLPAGADRADRVLIADHQFPGEAGPVDPKVMRSAIASGEVAAADALECLIDATANAVAAVQRPQLAHLFSILPKMGLDESALPDPAISHLARRARLAGAVLEVNEKWACPSARTVRAFAAAGVTLVAGTDSHHCEYIGAYSAVRLITESAHARTA